MLKFRKKVSLIVISLAIAFSPTSLHAILLGLNSVCAKRIDLFVAGLQEEEAYMTKIGGKKEDRDSFLYHRLDWEKNRQTNNLNYVERLGGGDAQKQLLSKALGKMDLTIREHQSELDYFMKYPDLKSEQRNKLLPLLDGYRQEYSRSPERLKTLEKEVVKPTEAEEDRRSYDTAEQIFRAASQTEGGWDNVKATIKTMFPFQSERRKKKPADPEAEKRNLESEKQAYEDFPLRETAKKINRAHQDGIPITEVHKMSLVDCCILVMAALHEDVSKVELKTDLKERRPRGRDVNPNNDISRGELDRKGGRSRTSTANPNGQLMQLQNPVVRQRGSTIHQPDDAPAEAQSTRQRRGGGEPPPPVVGAGGAPPTKAGDSKSTSTH